MHEFIQSSKLHILYLVMVLCVLDLICVFFFFSQGKLPMTGMTITKLEDSENHKNAFEISGIVWKYFYLLFNVSISDVMSKCFSF